MGFKKIIFVIAVSIFGLGLQSLAFGNTITLQPGSDIYIQANDDMRVVCDGNSSAQLISYCQCFDEGGSWGTTVLRAYTENLTTGSMVVNGRELARYSRNGSDGRTACANALASHPRCNVR